MSDDRKKSTNSVYGLDTTRREFLKYSAGTIGAISLSTLTLGCNDSNNNNEDPVLEYPIDPDVYTTDQRMISFPMNFSPSLGPQQLDHILEYGHYGYGEWTFGAGLPIIPRTDLMPKGYDSSLPTSDRQLLNFFAFSDIHITDKEAPNQLIHLQQMSSDSYTNTSIYSPVMMYTTHVLDAAIQTANALHKKNPFDFGISLGDTCNSTSYNELRWYLDVIDGQLITPSSGAHVGAETVDYQKPYKAAGLDKNIRWFQVMGNHDHFFIGSFPVDGMPSLRKAYVADTVWSFGDVLEPNPDTFPALFDVNKLNTTPAYYGGLFDGSSAYGKIIHAGDVTNPVFAAGAPKIVADPDRRSLVRADWVQAFFNTTTNPVGHGFNLVDKTNPAWDDNGFTCYSFVPNPDVPLKIIVLDDTQSETDGSVDIHGHGYLDKNRWAWLQEELDKGQANKQLMIIAAHIPIGVASIGAETEWWGQTKDILPEKQNAVDLAGLVKKLQDSPNLLMWVAGHRHLNVVKAFPSADAAKPEQGFWQVETPSLRDCPQQFRTFKIYLNSDYSISIETLNVDPSVAAGTPAATSRKYAIATQQIIKTDLHKNNQNFKTLGGEGLIPIPSMDPTRLQTDEPDQLDKSIRFVDMSDYKPRVPYNPSYNGKLFKQLSPEMVAELKRLFP